ncbi:unnamed protein product [Polarella glacialis]|uniref:Uncharacterized protein n=1 Tax=Polarella glacialis TaxID=89957 RepID=A0A813GHM6_POLGL|nr:unnamed protein product [Polarella glacialis]
MSQVNETYRKCTCVNQEEKKSVLSCTLPGLSQFHPPLLHVGVGAVGQQQEQQEQQQEQQQQQQQRQRTANSPGRKLADSVARPKLAVDLPLTTTSTTTSTTTTTKTTTTTTTTTNKQKRKQTKQTN